MEHRNSKAIICGAYQIQIIILYIIRSELINAAARRRVVVIKPKYRYYSHLSISTYRCICDKQSCQLSIIENICFMFEVTKNYMYIFLQSYHNM